MTQRHSHFEVTTRDGEWVVMEVFGVAERIAFTAKDEAEAERVCKEYNSLVEYPIA